jgi:large subunit ribosomal protein L29
MKASEIREKSTEDLRELEKNLVRELWKARFDNYSNQLDDTDKIRRLRRDVARVKTVLSARAKRQG